MSENHAPEISVDRARRAQSSGAIFIDVRDQTERVSGMIAGACADLSLPADAAPGASLIIYCASGVRSLAVANRLRNEHSGPVYSLRGGITAWRAAGLPVEGPDGLSPQESERYARQLVLPEVGLAGQLKLKSARVLLVGAGGLGSPAALYLAAAGVGSLRIVDADTVDRSNLHRQVLHSEDALGINKAESAARRLHALNPDIQIDFEEAQLSAENAHALCANMDLVLDGSDNWPTRQLSNRACVEAGIPLIYGAVAAFEGQVSVFCPSASQHQTPCLACLFPPDADTSSQRDCAQHGVLGVMPGLLGMLQATEALKWLLGLGEPLLGRMLIVDALGVHFRTLQTRARPDCPVCAGH